MKKILIILLSITLAFAGCGNDTTEEKEDTKEEVINKEELLDKFFALETDALNKMLEDADYTRVETDHSVYYLKSDEIEETRIDLKYKVDFLEEFDEFGLYEVYSSNGNSVNVITQEKTEDGYLSYSVFITDSQISLYISLSDEDGNGVSVRFDYEEGELNLVDELDEDEDGYKEYKKLLKEHEENAKEFFEDTFVELDSIIN